MKDDAADELDVEVAHLDGALAGFADDGEGFGEDVVEGGLFGGDALVGIFNAFDGGGDALAEFDGPGAEGLVGEGLHGGLEGVNLRDDGHEPLDGAFVAGAKDLSYSFVEQNRCPSWAHFVPPSSVNGMRVGTGFVRGFGSRSGFLHCAVRQVREPLRSK